MNPPRQIAVLTFAMLSVLLVGCGPSKEELRQANELAQMRTQLEALKNVSEPSQEEANTLTAMLASVTNAIEKGESADLSTLSSLTPNLHSAKGKEIGLKLFEFGRTTATWPESLKRIDQAKSFVDRQVRWERSNAAGIEKHSMQYSILSNSRDRGDQILANIERLDYVEAQGAVPRIRQAITEANDALELERQKAAQALALLKTTSAALAEEIDAYARQYLGKVELPTARANLDMPSSSLKQSLSTPPEVAGRTPTDTPSKTKPVDNRLRMLLDGPKKTQ